MAECHSRPNVFWVFICVMSVSGAVSGRTTLDFFFSGEEYQNASAISWAHAVNSVSALNSALKGNKQMLEVDILMGTKDGSLDVLPILAHPPDNTSDLTFEEFLREVISYSTKGKRGIKLDFKDIESVEPCLKLLKQNIKTIKFPVWLNADVLVGPGNSSTKPLDATQFLNLTRTYAPTLMLSLGWTTGYDCKSPGRYENEHIKEMQQLIERSNVQAPRTFPVRAGIAIESYDQLLNLVAFYPNSTLTIWSGKKDSLNISRVEDFISKIGPNRVYVDLPFNFNLVPHPNMACDITDRDENTTENVIQARNSTDGPKPDASIGSYVRSSLPVLALLLTVLALRRLGRF